jgi:cytoskeletal protein CcmA (bactofilin family)
MPFMTSLPALGIALFLVATSLAAGDGARADDRAGGTVLVQGQVGRDLYVAGGTVDVAAEVDGDVIAAGGQVTVDRDVRGDVLAAGGNVAIRARVGDDVRAAGGNVTVSGAVADEVVLGGARVLLAQSAQVGGRARLAGNTVQVAGRIDQGLKAAGTRIEISGRIAGDVELYADEIEIAPGASIGGDLVYYGREQARIAEGARIAGTVTRHRVDVGEDFGEGLETVGAAARIGLYVSLMLTGIVLFLLFPTGSVAAARTIGAAPWAALGLGFAVLVATPFLVLLLLVSLVGVWLGLALLALYFVLLLVGFLTGILYVGDRGLRWVGRAADASKGWYLLAIVLALLVLWLVRLIPVLGTVAVFALLLFGLGATTLFLWRRYMTPRAAAP